MGAQGTKLHSGGSSSNGGATVKAKDEKWDVLSFHRQYHCYECLVQIHPGQNVVCCECGHFAVCEPCYSAKPKVAAEHTSEATQQSMEGDEAMRLATSDGWRPSFTSFHHHVYREALVGPADRTGVRSSCSALTMSSALKTYSNRPCLGTRSVSETGEYQWKWLTYIQLHERAMSFGQGLLHTGVANPRDFVAIYSSNSVSWIACDLGCLFKSLVTVPISSTSAPDTMAAILNNAGICLIVCQSSLVSQLQRTFSDYPALCATVKAVVLMEDSSSEALSSFEIDGKKLAVHRMEAIEAAGKESKDTRGRRTKDIVPTKEEDLVTLMYTSGSTGKPKGCMITDRLQNRIFRSTIAGLDPLVTVLFVPLAHATGRRSVASALSNGGRVGISNGVSSGRFFEEVRSLRPTMIGSTPLLWNSLHHEYVVYCRRLQRAKNLISLQDAEDKEGGAKDAEAEEKVEGDVESQRSGEAKKLAETEKLKENQQDAAVNISQEVKEQGLEALRRSLGGRVQFAITGGAPSSDAVVQLVEDCFGVVMGRNGYGTTEAGAIASGGYVAPGCEVQLRSIPELGFLATDDPPRGEICVHNENTIPGYWNNPEANEGAFIVLNGKRYYRTGDIGELIGQPIGDPQLKVIDRCKEVFKLAQGFFVAPQHIEEVLEAHCPSVHQLFIFGSSVESYVVCAVVPTTNFLRTTAAQSSSSGEDSAKELERTRTQLLLAELRAEGALRRLQPHEVPKRLVIEPSPFTVENGLLTISLKKRRVGLRAHYNLQFEALYASDWGSDNSRAEETSREKLDQRPLWRLQRALREAVAEALGASASALVGQGDVLGRGFLELGGDSMAAVRALETIRACVKLAVRGLPKDLAAGLASDAVDGGKKEAGSTMSGGVWGLFRFGGKNKAKDVSQAKVDGSDNTPSGQMEREVAQLEREWLVPRKLLGASTVSAFILDVCAAVGKCTGTEAPQHDGATEGMQGPSPIGTQPIDWAAEATLSSDFVVPKDYAAGMKAGEGGVLLTGCTGYLGAFLLARMLSASSISVWGCGPVYCLVRAKDAQGARQRLERTLGAYKLLSAAVVKGLVDRVVALPGDLAAPSNLGLTDEQYGLLARQVHAIIHAGAVVNFVMSYRNMKPANVGGTKALLRLACTERVKFFAYISTIGVAPTNYAEKPIPDLAILTDRLPAYSQTKLIAENIVHEACRRGLPGVVFRPGTISSHTETGVTNLDLVARLWSGIVALGYYAEGVQPSSHNLVPVNFCTDTILSITDHLLEEWMKRSNAPIAGEGTNGEEKKESEMRPIEEDEKPQGSPDAAPVFHLVNNETTQLETVVAAANRLSDLSVRKVEWEEWCVGVVKVPPTHPLFPFKLSLSGRRSPSALRGGNEWGTTRTTALLKWIKRQQQTVSLRADDQDSGFPLQVRWTSCPRITPEMLLSSLQYLIEKK